MKKLLLALVTLASLQVFAQKDLQITMAAPINGQTIYANTNFNILFTLKNAGNVAIAATDSIVFGVVINNQVVYAVNVTHGVMNPGDTAPLALNNFKLNFTTSVQNANFCAVTTLRYSGNLDSNSTNNMSCATVNMSTATGVNELAAASSVKVYPNPASSLVNFDFNYAGHAQVNVFDMTGKKVAAVNAASGDTKLDVSNLNNGIYMYEILGADNSLIKSGRFNVAH